LLVEFEKPIGWKFYSLEFYLQKIFNKKNDIATKNALKPQLKEAILNHVSYIK